MIRVSNLSPALSIQPRSQGLSYYRPWGPFLERLTGPISHFQIKVSRREGCVLTSNQVHFVSLADNLTTIFKTFETPILSGKQNSLTGHPENYRELRETGPW